MVPQAHVKNFINGQKLRNDRTLMDVISPLDGSVISDLAMSNSSDLDIAVEAAKEAYPIWSGMTLKERVQIFFKYRQLLEENIEELTELVHLENGKTLDEARAEVLKSMELCGASRSGLCKTD